MLKLIPITIQFPFNIESLRLNKREINKSNFVLKYIIVENN